MQPLERAVSQGPLERAVSQEPLERFLSIETPEHITLDVELAGVGSRFAAYAIDLLWQLVAIAAATAIAIASIGVSVFSGGWPTKTGDELPHVAPAAIAILSLVIFAVNFGYFAFFEIVWRGQSPGKRRFRLRVIQEGGFPLTVRAALIRNLLRIVDFLPASYLVGIAAIWLGPRAQRLGDLAARTIVVREAKPGEPPFARGERDPMKALIADFWAWHWRVDAGAAQLLASSVAATVAARRGQPPPQDPWTYLEQAARGG